MSKRNSMIIFLKALLLLAIFAGCRGQESRLPPIHLNPNMDNQEKYMPYGENDFFEDGRNMRPLPEGTVARGHLNADEGYYLGKVNGEYISNPLPLTEKLLLRGQERYDIYCSMCHGLTGEADGIVIEKGYVRPPSYFDERIINMTDGQIYEAITKGVRVMPSYKLQVPVEDRWAIVAYIRALQNTRATVKAEKPENVKQGSVN